MNNFFRAYYVQGSASPAKVSAELYWKRPSSIPSRSRAAGSRVGPVAAPAAKFCPARRRLCRARSEKTIAGGARLQPLMPCNCGCGGSYAAKCDPGRAAFAIQRAQGDGGRGAASLSERADQSNGLGGCRSPADAPMLKSLRVTQPRDRVREVSGGAWNKRAVAELSRRCRRERDGIGLNRRHRKRPGAVGRPAF